MAKSGKIRLDARLTALGLAESRTRAQALIMAGRVFADDRRVDKPGALIAPGAALEVKGADHPWVSRGGVKLAHGLTHFGFSAEGVTAVDVGASTGGFTDVLLHAGAARVYAVDVGRGQMAWKLRSDPRVIMLEKTNARNLSAEHVPEPAGAVVCDASFISLETVLPAALKLTAPEAWCIALIKPQFEAGRGQVGKNGVVKDPALHAEICARIERWFTETIGWRVLGTEPSPITGPAGNVEFLIAAEKKS
ncbi:MAG: TlyA family RNA methyltransferase [Rhodospirillales bacterium]